MEGEQGAVVAPEVGECDPRQIVGTRVGEGVVGRIQRRGVLGDHDRHEQNHADPLRRRGDDVVRLLGQRRGGVEGDQLVGGQHARLAQHHVLAIGEQAAARGDHQAVRAPRGSGIDRHVEAGHHPRRQGPSEAGEMTLPVLLLDRERGRGEVPTGVQIEAPVPARAPAPGERRQDRDGLLLPL
jgi:hypothetical protein